jgi:hypothetical protein
MSRKHARFLLDVNVLVALADREHVHHRIVTRTPSAPYLPAVGRRGIPPAPGSCLPAPRCPS